MKYAMPAWRAILLGLLACLSVSVHAGEPEVDARDPWEGFNRKVYAFNDGLDSYFLRPVATGYVTVTPLPARTWVSNFFGNIGDVWMAANNLLQGKPKAALSDTGRVVINSTIGLLGAFDVATEMGLERSDEDFGQTLAVWGLGNGPYLVLPLLGPSTLRDGSGLVLDYAADPLSYVEPGGLRYGTSGLRIVNARSQLLGTEKLLQGAALDEYSYRREFHLKRRQYLIYDGRPPRNDEDE